MSPSPEEVRHELEAILANRAFAASARLSRFLRYVVERTLAGDGERLKEYVLGIEVFDRGSGYDPRIDSIVRVEAGRVRDRLEQYYAADGAGSRVRIRMPKGGYAPLFETRSESLSATEPDSGRANGSSTAGGSSVVPGSTSATPGTERSRSPRSLRRSPLRIAAVSAAAGLVAVAAWFLPTGPTTTRAAIAVLPFSASSADDADQMLATRLTERVTTELVRRGEMIVVASTSARVAADARTSMREVSRALDAEFLLQARTGRDDRGLWVEARLVRGPLEQKFWVDNFAGTEEELDGLCERIAAGASVAIAASVAQSSSRP